MTAEEIREMLAERFEYHRERSYELMGCMKHFNDEGDYDAANNMWRDAMEHNAVAFELCMCLREIEEARNA